MYSITTVWRLAEPPFFLVISSFDSNGDFLVWHRLVKAVLYGSRFRGIQSRFNTKERRVCQRCFVRTGLRGITDRDLFSYRDVRSATREVVKLVESLSIADDTSSATTLAEENISPAISETRVRAKLRYSESISKPTLLRPQRAAATHVVPVPTNGSSTVSPTKENMRTNRSASDKGNGAG